MKSIPPHDQAALPALYDTAPTQATALVRYDALCRALAEAVLVDEVKDIHDQAAAMAEYARRAKNRNLEANAVALRMRATRRLSELIDSQKQTVGLATGAEHGGRVRIDGLRANPSIIRPTLAMQGIDKNLAHQARVLGRLSDAEFEQTVAQARDAVTSAVAKVVKSITLPKEETAASEAEIEITLAQWVSISEAERRECLDPKNYASNAKFNTQDSERIDWAQQSWNPIVGCKHSCRRYCWAHDVTLRFPHRYRHGFEPVFRPRMLNAPRNTPVPPEAASDWRFKNVFVCSMSDMFGGWIPSEWIEAILATERANPQWNFLHLTKFPRRIAEFDIPPNVWLGTTVDVQARVANAEAAFAKLREKLGKDAVLWLSIEPMLEPIKFKRLDLFNWMVIGGAARSMRTPEFRPPGRWIADLVRQADAADVKVFEKTNLHGNRILELPFDAPIKHDFPQVAPNVFHYLGKRKADDGEGEP